MPKKLPLRPSMVQLRRQAKDLLKQLRSQTPDAIARVDRCFPEWMQAMGKPEAKPSIALHQAQRVIAREFGFSSWARLKRHVESPIETSGQTSHVALLARVYERVSNGFSADAPIIVLMRRMVDCLLESYLQEETWVFVVLSNCSPLRAGKSRSEVFGGKLEREEGRDSIARYFGFSSWGSIGDAGEGSLDSRFEEAVDAVITGDLEGLSMLLELDPELSRCRSCWGHRATLLHYVAANGVEIHRQEVPKNAVAIARLLLESGAVPDALAETYGGGLNQTPLALLVTSGHPHEQEVVEPLVALLAEFGAQLDGLDFSGTPVKMALEFGYKRTADALVRSGGTIVSLEVAAGMGVLSELMTFLASKPEPQQLSKSLYFAARYGHESCVQPLIQAGADLNVRGWAGAPALHWAAFGGYQGIVKLLVAAGSDPNLRDHRFRSHAAGWANEGQNFQIRNWLQEQGCRTSVTEAAAFGQIGLVEALVKRDPSVVNLNEGRTPLHEAAGRGNVPMTKFLLAHGADRSATDAQGLQPVDWARHGEHKQILSILEG